MMKAEKQTVALKTAYEQFNAQEQDEFWKKAAHVVKISKFDLTPVIFEIERCENGASRMRPSSHGTTGLRKKSKAEQQKAVLRFKNQLFDQSNAELLLLLQAQIQEFVSEKYQSALVAVLDAVDCPHNGNGTLTSSQSVPHVDPEQAKEALQQLVPNYGTKTILLICAALMVKSHWSSLELAFDELCQMIDTDQKNSVIRRESATINIQPGTLSATTVDMGGGINFPSDESLTFDAIDVTANAPPEISRDYLAALGATMDALRPRLLEAAELLRNQVFPDAAETCHLWQVLGERIAHARQMLGTASARLGDLQSALAYKEARIAILDVLTQCRSITHATQSDFAGLAEIRRGCDDLQTQLENEGSESKGFQAARDLVELVRENQTLDDEVYVAKLSSSVRFGFGELVCTYVFTPPYAP